MASKKIKSYLSQIIVMTSDFILTRHVKKWTQPIYTLLFLDIATLFNYNHRQISQQPTEKLTIVKFSFHNKEWRKNYTFPKGSYNFLKKYSLALFGRLLKKVVFNLHFKKKITSNKNHMIVDTKLFVSIMYEKNIT